MEKPNFNFNTYLLLLSIVILLFTLAAYINLSQMSNVVKQLSQLISEKGTAALALADDFELSDETKGDGESSCSTDIVNENDEYPYTVTYADDEAFDTNSPLEETCDVSTDEDSENSRAQASACPTITQISPGSKYFGSYSFQLVIQGTNFSPTASQVWFGNWMIPATSFDITNSSTTQLVRTIPASRTLRTGNVEVGVRNNFAGGGSVITNFTLDPLPTPTLDIIFPASAKVGSTLTVTAFGDGFVNNQIKTYVRVNNCGSVGSKPAFSIDTDNPNNLKFNLVGADVSAVKTLKISVKNYAPPPAGVSNPAAWSATAGGGTSSEVDFNVTP